jgi:hypothetical protein
MHACDGKPWSPVRDGWCRVFAADDANFPSEVQDAINLDLMCTHACRTKIMRQFF